MMKEKIPDFINWYTMESLFRNLYIIYLKYVVELYGS